MINIILDPHPPNVIVSIPPPPVEIPDFSAPPPPVGTPTVTPGEEETNGSVTTSPTRENININNNPDEQQGIVILPPNYEKPRGIIFYLLFYSIFYSLFYSLFYILFYILFFILYSRF
jgi:hypothetical protein